MGGIRLGMKGTRNVMFCFKRGVVDAEGSGVEGGWRWIGIGGGGGWGWYGFFWYWGILVIGKIGFWVSGKKFL